MADTKDWTWVLDRACPDCGFDAGALPRTEIGATIRGVVERFAVELERSDDVVRRRPGPEVWSTLEYGCHLVDVAVIFAGRLQLMRTEVDPTFPNWDQDETAIARRYAEQDPTAVRVELQRDGSVLADDFDGVGDDEWARQGFRSNGSVFTVESLGRYLAHDLVHHVWDIDRGVPVGSRRLPVSFGLRSKRGARCMARLAAGRTTALTADEIVDVALRQVDDFGLDSLTMGNIAAELNVSQMALYRHFDSKGHLLRGMLDRVWNEGLAIGSLPEDPIEIMVVGAMSLWQAFARHPQIGVLLGATPEMGQQAENLAIGIEVVMRQAGFDPERLGEAYLPISTYMLGAIALLGSRVAAKGPMAPVTTAEARRGFDESSSEMGSQILKCMVPTMAEAEASYERGLRALVSGLLADQQESADRRQSAEA